ncbi:hypothetical protein CYCD_20810 [Tenuifilaceae bacterium CYCD]|nr:hypothetical protein CYCD_20810 [Tenuifilaceae bacterium CYCD]
MKKLLLFVGLVLLITSCDPGATDVFNVDNQSDWEVLVGYKQWDVDTVIAVAPKELRTVYVQNYLGVAGDGGDSFLSPFDTLYINVNDTMELGMSCMQRRNWELKVSSKNCWRGDGGIAEYKLIIENDDIVRRHE